MSARYDGDRPIPPQLHDFGRRVYLPIQAFAGEFTLNLRMPPLIGLIENSSDNPQPMEGIEEWNDAVDLHTCYFPGDLSTNIGVVEYAWSVSHDNNT